ncbi:MAG: amino acid synthesis family protein [Rhodospirillales bacterium]
MTPRKVQLIKETVLSEAGGPADPPATRAAVLLVLENPFAGRFVEDLSLLIDASLELGARYMPDVVALLAGPPRAYGKAAIVGVEGDVEHAAALLHPKLGKPMRAAVGGGEALIPATAKVAGCGTPIDVPLGHKDEIWSFDELDTLTLFLADAPRPREIVMIMAASDGTRPRPRVGKGRAVT